MCEQSNINSIRSRYRQIHRYTNRLPIAHTHTLEEKTNTNDRKVIFDNKAGFVENEKRKQRQIFLFEMALQFSLHHFSPLSQFLFDFSLCVLCLGFY